MRKVVGLVCLFMFVLSSVCLAKQVDHIYHDDHVLEPSEVAIGGVYVGMSEEDLHAVYGEPASETEYKPDYLVGGQSKTVKYGDSFSIVINDGYVLDLSSNARNGLQMPSGIQVGDIKAKILPTYGKPMRYWENSKTHSSNFVYRTSGGVHLRFEVIGGAITLISIIGYE
ncbi:hypothetical protein [uncultured Selenomonas sp.]|uniref:hypothetical protein n=1 Tax=uncultured Selenomonas sp. TaxID=159275 RepID=UPI0025E77DC8|nr:hypothetical protein [uncultured Selenomonas sp.]